MTNELKGAQDRLLQYEINEKMLKRELELRDDKLKRLETDIRQLQASWDTKQQMLET